MWSRDSRCFEGNAIAEVCAGVTMPPMVTARLHKRGIAASPAPLDPADKQPTSLSCGDLNMPIHWAWFQQKQTAATSAGGPSGAAITDLVHRRSHLPVMSVGRNSFTLLRGEYLVRIFCVGVRPLKIRSYCVAAAQTPSILPLHRTQVKDSCVLHQERSGHADRGSSHRRRMIIP